MKTIMKASLTTAMSLLLALPAMAAAPAEGEVIEGDSVPGLALGDNRAQAEASYGQPGSCQSVEAAGDRAFCSFPVDGGGQVDVRYRGPDGGNASNSPDDVVTAIDWHEPVSGWLTTAGVNTSLAAEDRSAVVAAYPDAEVNETGNGIITSVVAHEQGVHVRWVPDFYSGTSRVQMGIFQPRPAPPPVEKLTRVIDIDLTAHKGKGKRKITALVQVRNERELAAAGALVLATWTYPDGSIQPEHQVADDTSSTGYAYFEIPNAQRGTYTLRIDDVILDDHRFDLENSVLEATIAVR